MIKHANHDNKLNHANPSTGSANRITEAQRGHTKARSGPRSLDTWGPRPAGARSGWHTSQCSPRFLDSQISKVLSS